MSQCLKCGKNVEQPSVFCGECLAVMEQYPVKPGTVVHLPRRQTTPETKSQIEFEEHNHKEQLASQRGLIRWLTATVAVLSIMLVITAVLLIHTLENDKQLPMIGRNYTTSTSTSKP